MKHPSINVKSFTVKEGEAYRVRVESWEAVIPKDMLSVNFVQECLNKDGEVDFASTYSYNVTRAELTTLCKGLLNL
jgi:hypothetical protein